MTEFKRTVVYHLEQRRGDGEWLIQWTLQSFTEALLMLQQSRQRDNTGWKYRLVEFETVRRLVVENL